MMVLATWVVQVEHQGRTCDVQVFPSERVEALRRRAMDFFAVDNGFLCWTPAGGRIDVSAVIANSGLRMGAVVTLGAMNPYGGEGPGSYQNVQPGEGPVSRPPVVLRPRSGW